MKFIFVSFVALACLHSVLALPASTDRKGKAPVRMPSGPRAQDGTPLPVQPSSSEDLDKKLKRIRRAYTIPPPPSDERAGSTSLYSTTHSDSTPPNPSPVRPSSDSESSTHSHSPAPNLSPVRPSSDSESSTHSHSPAPDPLPVQQQSTRVRKNRLPPPPAGTLEQSFYTPSVASQIPHPPGSNVANES